MTLCGTRSRGNVSRTGVGYRIVVDGARLRLTSPEDVRALEPERLIHASSAQRDMMMPCCHVSLLRPPLHRA
jgi:hypothetical protein